MSTLSGAVIIAALLGVAAWVIIRILIYFYVK